MEIVDSVFLRRGLRLCAVGIVLAYVLPNLVGLFIPLFAGILGMQLGATAPAWLRFIHPICMCVVVSGIWLIHLSTTNLQKPTSWLIRGSLILSSVYVVSTFLYQANREHWFFQSLGGARDWIFMAGATLACFFFRALSFQLRKKGNAWLVVLVLALFLRAIWTLTGLGVLLRQFALSMESVIAAIIVETLVEAIVFSVPLILAWWLLSQMRKAVPIETA